MREVGAHLSLTHEIFLFFICFCHEFLRTLRENVMFFFGWGLIHSYIIRTMKKINFNFTLIAALATLVLMGLVTTAFKPAVTIVDEQEPAAETPLDLFLGMDYDEDYSYVGSDSLLYRFPGLIMQEVDATWYNCIDDDFFCKFRCSLGLYIDKEYPSQAVFSRVEAAIDTLLVVSLGGFDGLDSKQAYRLLETNRPQNAQQMLDFGRRVFDLYTSQMKATKPESTYETLPEGRLCLVGHKVYDKGDQATYLIEMSFDYNGSNGCPSMAHYLTIDKNTGKILQPEDVISKYGADKLKRLLYASYKKERVEKGFDGDDAGEASPDVLLTSPDGCAIINEGVMFYYLPYNIGCGAEAEYHLILDLH